MVDYHGVGRHLKDPLAVYAAADVERVLASLKDEIPILRDRHERVVRLFRDRGAALDDQEACVRRSAMTGSVPISWSS